MSVLKRWRVWVSLFMLSFCFYAIKPNFSENQVSQKINFGLDIQGGYSYLLELNQGEYKENLLTKTSQILESAYNINSSINNGNIVIPTNQNLDALDNITIQSLGIELLDNTSDEYIYSISEQSFNQSLSDMTLNAVEIVRSRVDYLGNKELSIQKVGLNKILLEIPGNLDSNVKDVISKTAKLTLHLEKKTFANTTLFTNESTGEEVRVQEIANLTGDFI